MPEQFQPVSNTPPTGFSGRLKFYGRMLLDLQLLTIYRQVKKTLPSFRGDVLDIGCGQSPYRVFLDESKTKYFGIDVQQADAFGYNNPDITFFDGKNIPFENEKFNGIICTEVLEHVEEYQYLINEIHRTTKTDASILVTVPWSARYHYIPYDYFRYTPSSLKTMFAGFRDVTIKPRGGDTAVITSKIVILFARGLVPVKKWRIVFVPFYLVALPILFISVAVAHLSLWLDKGSKDDPLGYTVICKK